MATSALEFAYYDRLHAEKYRDTGQTFEQHAASLADRLSTDKLHAEKLNSMFLGRKFLAAGRVQAAMGARDREVSAFNCSVSRTIDDSMDSIMDALSEAAKILRLGTGIGYNFSKLRPKGALIKKLQTQSSGPLSFMKIFDVMASTIASSGHRRGAQMGIMNIDHPDIEEFIDAKLTQGAYRQFNFSVGITDAFMFALEQDADWPLVFDGRVCRIVKAKYLWEKVMRNAYNSAEPGVIFIDKLNKDNNLYYCENIDATNPCAEQPLPPNGLCLLGSFNLTKYVYRAQDGTHNFNFDTFIPDIYNIVEAYDNVFERSTYAIEAHKKEALSKRRMGIGLTGISNAIELICGQASYGNEKFIRTLNLISRTLSVHTYMASTMLAKKRGSFELFDRNKYVEAPFLKTMPDKVVDHIYKYGMRNSHLLSYAPCGTISQTAGNVSSGVEPIFYHSVSRDVFMKDGKENVTLMDYNVRNFEFYGKTLEECSIPEHINVAAICQKHCDSAVSKTINVASTCPMDQYEKVYIDAFKAGSKGITVFRPTEIRGAVITENKEAANAKEFKYGESGSCVDGSCAL